MVGAEKVNEGRYGEIFPEVRTSEPRSYLIFLKSGRCSSHITSDRTGVLTEARAYVITFAPCRTPVVQVFDVTPEAFSNNTQDPDFPSETREVLKYMMKIYYEFKQTTADSRYRELSSHSNLSLTLEKISAFIQRGTPEGKRKVSRIVANMLQPGSIVNLAARREGRLDQKARSKLSGPNVCIFHWSEFDISLFVEKSGILVKFTQECS
jgi:hypothetical protein